MDIKSSKRVSLRKRHFASEQQECIRQLEAEGKSVINLGRGNHDQGTFKPIIDVFKEAVDLKDNQGYPPYGGKESLKQAIIDFYAQEYGVFLKREEVTIFSGSLSSLTALPMVLADEGDVVLSPDPSFFAYHTGITMAGARNVTMPLTAANDYFPNYEQLSPEDLRQARLMFLNYPHNPTGKGATIDFFEETVAFAKEHGIVVAHDFAYADINFHGKSPSFLQAEGAKEVGIEIFSLSKIFNMAGWRIAFAVGNKDVISLLNGYIRASVGGTFGAVQDAVTYALGNTTKERDSLRQLYATRQRVVVDYLKNHSIDVLDSDGTFFLWIRLPEGVDDVTFVGDLLREKYVALIPGSTFGQEGRGFVRLSLVSEVSVLLEGAKRLADFLTEKGR